MDPHLAAVREWNKNYLPSEKEAYQAARIDGYIFPTLGGDGKIGALTGDELESIASYPPILDLSRYKRYRNMTFEQLEDEFPALVDIIGKGNITYEDLFYYATRGFVPEYDSIDFMIDRWNQYNELSDVGRILMDEIYQDREGYVNKSGHPLEKYVIAFDQNMDSESTIRAIGERIGISIPPESPAHDVFFEKLLDYIRENEGHAPDRVKRQNSLSTSHMIDMTEKEYYDYITEKGFKDTRMDKKYYPNQYYSDRLSTIRK
jgi:hypothetical protein